MQRFTEDQSCFGREMEKRSRHRQIGHAKDEADLDLLHPYVDLEFGDQPFAARITILDRILVLGGERQNHLQYRGAKAIQYFLIGDVKTAELQL